LDAPIVLIRGLFREKRHWGSFPDRLQSTLPDRQVITLNVAGAGERNNLTSPSSIAKMVDDLREQLSLLHPDISRFNLLGLSMGGMITLEWCQRFPEEVDKAILINTSTGSLSPFHQRLRWQQYGNILTSVVKNTEQRERFSYQLCSNTPVNESVLTNWVSWAKSDPMSTTSSFNQLIACLNYKISHQPRTDMLVLTSTEDQMVSPKCSRTLASHWSLPIIEHPSAGHDISIDDPDWVCEHVRAFLTD
jgi:pimeloyl-ACP methyl ester carboxylesterase